MHLEEQSRAGLTLVEVMVAVVVLAIGVCGLVGSFALAARMTGRGRVESRVAQVAAGRMELLRLAAGSTTPRCASGSFAAGGPLSTQTVTERWEVTPTGPVRQVRVIVSYPIPGGAHTDTLETRIDC